MPRSLEVPKRMVELKSHRVPGAVRLKAWLWCIAHLSGVFGTRGRSTRGASVWSVGVASSYWIWHSAGAGDRWLSVSACTQLREHASIGIADASCMASQNSWPYSLISFHRCIKVAHDDELLLAVHFPVEWPLLTLKCLFPHGICHERGRVHSDDGGGFTSLKDSAEGHKVIRVSYREACQLAGHCVLRAPCSVIDPCSTKRYWEMQSLLFVSFPVSHR